MSSRLTQPVRIGQIDYVNVRPFFANLASRWPDERLQLVQGVPSHLNRLLAEGEIDLAPVSSIAFARHANDWVLLPDLSVSSRGEVRSILLLHREPIECWKNMTVGLTTSSETSVQLLKLLLGKCFSGSISYVSGSPDAREQLKHRDAALVIGDDALRFLLDPPEGIMITDLGKWWRELEQRSMTYAVWAVRKSFVNQQPERIQTIHAHLHENICKRDQQMSEMINWSMQRMGGNETFWRAYFEGLDYHLTTQQLDDLRYFYECAKHAGTLEQVPSLHVGQDILDLQVGR